MPHGVDRPLSARVLGGPLSSDDGEAVPVAAAGGGSASASGPLKPSEMAMVELSARREAALTATQIELRELQVGPLH